MASERPISDETIVHMCYVISVISFPINLTSLILICRMWKKSARRIVVVLTLLQVFYILHNIYFTLYISFFCLMVAGGYCIGPLCQPNYVSFNVNIIVIIILFVNIMAMFTLLLFYRHQSLLLNSSRLKLSNSATNVMTSLIISLINLMPAWQAFAQHRLTESEANRTMATISACTIALLLNIYMIFAVAITIHICKIFKDYAKMRSTGSYATKISGTKQSLVQMGTFLTFSAFPIVNVLSLAIIDFEDDSVVQIPNVILFSLMSLTHSSLTIYHSPFIRRSRPLPKTSISVSAIKSQKSCDGSGLNHGKITNSRKSTITNRHQIC